MTGKENVKKAIEFGKPEYLPIELNFDPNWMNEKNENKVIIIKELFDQLKQDILNPSPFVHSVGEIIREGNKSFWLDEWGTGWEDDGYGTKAVTFPLEDGYELLSDYKFPQPQDMLKENDGSKYVRANVWFTLFERMWMLRGFENMLMDPYINTSNFEYFRDKIVDFNLARIEEWLKLNVDGIFFSDDWGTQRGLLMNPEDWRKYYKPAYAKMFRKVREGDAHVWMHLCGDIRLILPDLIEVGLNVLNPVQPQAMDVNELAADFSGKVCFNGGVDVQDTLVNGTPDDVKQEVYKLVDLFGKYDGGYIGATSHTIMPETPLDNVIAMLEAFAEVQ